MNNTVQGALDVIEDVTDKLGPWGGFVSGALSAIEGAILNAEAGVDPTPEETQKLIDKISIPGPALIPKRPQ